MNELERLEPAIGLPSRSTGASWMLAFLMPAEVRGILMLPLLFITRVDLDAELWRAVSDWMADSWPFERFEYAARS